MFRYSIAAVIGLSAIISAASADTIIVQNGPHLALPAYDFPTLNPNVLHNPAFGRLVEMCDRMGMECAAPHADVFAQGDLHPLLSPEARADAEKRLDLLTRQWEEYADDLQVLPAPILPRPQMLFGWNAPRIVPLPRALPFGFSDRFPTMPHTVLPRIDVPRIQGFSGFDPRFATPRLTIPRSYGFPHGPTFSWPFL